MPQYDPKQVQKELNSNKIWPVYWIYGTETMKVRELVKRIKTCVAPQPLNLEIMDGESSLGETIVDSANTMALGGGTRFLIVRNANLLKSSEAIESLFSTPSKAEKLFSVVVFISKDLDKRKKLTKQLLEKTAVVNCEEVNDNAREPWILYLAKRKELIPEPSTIAFLRSLEPWSLDLVDQELEKISLEQACDFNENDEARIGSALEPRLKTDSFLSAFFERDARLALPYVKGFANNPQEAIPLLGLLGWNVRHLALWVADESTASRSIKVHPFVLDRLRRWSRKWDFRSIERLQNTLGQIDFSTKQTPRLPIGLWTDLVLRYCKPT